MYGRMTRPRGRRAATLWLSAGSLRPGERQRSSRGLPLYISIRLHVHYLCYMQCFTEVRGVRQ